jgi:hypothetical protein
VTPKAPPGHTSKAHSSLDAQGYASMPKFFCDRGQLPIQFVLFIPFEILRSSSPRLDRPAPMLLKMRQPKRRTLAPRPEL